MSKYVRVFVTGISPRNTLDRGAESFVCDEDFDPESFFSSEQLEEFRGLLKSIGWNKFTITGFQCI